MQGATGNHGRTYTFKVHLHNHQGDPARGGPPRNAPPAWTASRGRFPGRPRRGAGRESIRAATTRLGSGAACTRGRSSRYTGRIPAKASPTRRFPRPHSCSAPHADELGFALRARARGAVTRIPFPLSASARRHRPRAWARGTGAGNGRGERARGTGAGDGHGERARETGTGDGHGGRARGTGRAQRFAGAGAGAGAERPRRGSCWSRIPDCGAPTPAGRDLRQEADTGGCPSSKRSGWGSPAARHVLPGQQPVPTQLAGAAEWAPDEEGERSLFLPGDAHPCGALDAWASLRGEVTWGDAVAPDASQFLLGASSKLAADPELHVDPEGGLVYSRPPSNSNYHSPSWGR